MSEDTAADGPGHPQEADPAGQPTDPARRRRRAEVFGDVLPELTDDERGDGWSEPDPQPDATDEWLRRQVPPHHG